MLTQNKYEIIVGQIKDNVMTKKTDRREVCVPVGEMQLKIEDGEKRIRVLNRSRKICPNLLTQV